MKQTLKKYGLFVFVFISLFLNTAATLANPGDLDPTFNGNGKLRVGVGGGNDVGMAVARQSDGKVLVAGLVVNAGESTARIGILRYNTNGLQDLTFGSGGRAFAGPITISQFKLNIAVLPDGKIVVSGTSAAPQFSFLVFKLNSDGTADSTFGNAGRAAISFGQNVTSEDMAVQSDGKIVVAGEINNSNVAVARFNADGSPDASFNGTGSVSTVVPGSTRSETRVVAVQGTKILVGGIKQPGINQQGIVIRYNANGSLDTSFGGGDGIVELTNGAPTTRSSVESMTFLAPDADTNTILLAGLNLVAVTGSVFRDVPAVWSLNAADGSFNTAFGTGGVSNLPDSLFSGPTAIKVQFNAGLPNRIVVGGTGGENRSNFGYVKFLLDGTPDNAFGQNGFIQTDFNSSTDNSAAMLIQPADNKVVLVGTSDPNNSNGGPFAADNDFAVARYNVNGSLDTSFDADGKRTDDIGDGVSSATSTAIQADGKIIAAGGRALARFNPDGSFDASFGSFGKVSSLLRITAIALQTDGKIVTVGADQSGVLAVGRYNSNGTPDTTLDSDGIVQITGPLSASHASVALQTDGKIVVSTQSSTMAGFITARIHTDGAIDFSFSGGTRTTSINSGGAANATLCQPDGKVLVAGYSFSSTSSAKIFTIIRYNFDGGPDNSFGTSGIVTTPILGFDQINSIALQSDGKIVAAGTASTSETANTVFAVVRYLANGQLDTAFGTGGKVTTPLGTINDTANGVALQLDGKILVAGSTQTASGQDFAVVRYNANGSLDSSLLRTDRMTRSKAEIKGSPDPLYGSGGKVIIDVSGGLDQGNAMAIDPLGRAVIAGTANNRFGIIRLMGDVATAATVSVSGRVVSAEGRGVRGALASITDANGITKTAVTGPLGNFSFDAVEAGGTYIITISARRFQFTPQVITITDNVTGIEFTPEN